MDTGGIYRGVLLNTSLLLSIAVIDIIFLSRLYRYKNSVDGILTGIIAGAAGIFLIIHTLPLPGGVFLDTRTIIAGITGLFFGAVPALISAAIICLYRAYIGGSGALAGIAATLICALTGVIWNRLRLKKIKKTPGKAWLEYLSFGFVLHILAIPALVLLSREYSDSIIITAVVFLTAFPTVTMLCAMLIGSKTNELSDRELYKTAGFQYKKIMEQAPIGVLIGRGNRIVYVNPAYEKITGREKDEILQKGWRSYTHPEDLNGRKDQFRGLCGGKIDSYKRDKRYIRPDGEQVWVNVTVAALNLDEGIDKSFICMVIDMTEFVGVKSDLQKSSADYKKLYQDYYRKQILLLNILNSIPDLIFYKDIDGKYIGCNSAFESFTGKNSDEIIGRTDWEIFDKKTAEAFVSSDERVMIRKKQQASETHLKSKAGEEIDFETIRTPLYGPGNSVLGLIGISRNITERREREARISYLNYHDVLTGMFNRLSFDEELHKIDRPESLPLTIIMGDINGLKLINDAFGHEHGDLLLRRAADIIKTCVGGRGIAFRIGGDEFAILMPRTDEEEAHEVIRNIVRECESNSQETDTEMNYTSISLGYATKNKDEDITEIRRLAEGYMYRKKLLEQKSLHSSIITSIKTTMFEKSHETEAHAERLAELSIKLGLEMGLNEEQLNELELLATLHDVGKIGIDIKNPKKDR